MPEAINQNDSIPRASETAALMKDFERFYFLQKMMELRQQEKTNAAALSVQVQETIVNPSPIGLCGFALTTFVLSCFNAGLWISPSVSHGPVLGLALFYGGLVQMIAGFFEMKVGNLFGALAFTSYGGFWLSLASLSVKSFDFVSAMPASDLERAMGIYLLGWTLFSFFMFLHSFRTTRLLAGLFGILVITFSFLTAAKFQSSLVLQQIGGSFGIVCALMAWYAAFAGVSREIYGIQWPMGSLKPVAVANPPSSSESKASLMAETPGNSSAAEEEIAMSKV